MDFQLQTNFWKTRIEKLKANISQSRRAKRRGFAILTVLLSLALLASIMVGFTGAVQNRISRISGDVKVTQAQLYAESGLEIAAGLLLHSLGQSIDSPNRLVANGERIICRINDRFALSLSLQDVAGQLDLNVAPTKAIAAALSQYYPSQIASNLASEIEARRHKARYRFVEELGSFQEVSVEKIPQLKNDFTVNSGRNRLSEDVISVGLRQALARLPSGNQYFGGRPTNRVYAVKVVAFSLPHYTYHLNTTLELRPGQHPLYRPLQWQGYGAHIRNPEKIFEWFDQDLIATQDLLSLPLCIGPLQ